MAILWADKDGKLVRFLRNEIEMALAPDVPSDGVTSIDFNIADNQELAKTIFDNWNNVTLLVTNRKTTLMLGTQELTIQGFTDGSWRDKLGSVPIKTKVNEIIAWANKQGASIQPLK